MKKNSIQIPFMILVLVLLFMITLTGCTKNRKGSTDSAEKTILGTWQTASMGYEYYGTNQPEYYVQFTDNQPEYYVQFTDSEIIYGHMKNGEYVPDHTDRIIRLEEISPDEFKVQAESSNGILYTYMTCESNHDVLEYYGTLSEEEFPETYSIGASLSRCS